MKNKELRDMTLTYAYEGSKVAGVYNMITFVHTGFSHPYANVIKKHFLTFDYIPKYMSNSIDERTGSIKPPKKKSSKQSLEDSADFSNIHWNLHSYVEESKNDNKEILLDYKEFLLNLKKFHNIVPGNMRKRPMYKFLCFILNPRHQNTTILSHYGSKFDMIILCELLLSMQFTPLIIPQGHGILQMIVKEFNITFTDTFKFFAQKLETLPHRFQIEETKGFFSHVENKPENWGILRREPFALETYISGRDSEKVKKEKEKWHSEFKKTEPWFDLNDQCVRYCERDVILLLKSSLKFIVQSFGFGQEMISRFGQSLAYREGHSMTHFHPFHKFPTLGSYSLSIFFHYT